MARSPAVPPWGLRAFPDHPHRAVRSRGPVAVVARPAQGELRQPANQAGFGIAEQPVRPAP